jgi:hypothetical protein
VTAVNGMLPVCSVQCGCPGRTRVGRVRIRHGSVSASWQAALHSPSCGAPRCTTMPEMAGACSIAEIAVLEWSHGCAAAILLLRLQRSSCLICSAAASYAQGPGDDACEC